MTFIFNTGSKFIVGEKSIKNVVTDGNSKNSSVKVYLSLFYYYVYTEETTLIYVEKEVIIYIVICQHYSTGFVFIYIILILSCPAALT